MSRIRCIIVCLLAVVLIAGQSVTGAQATAMVLDEPMAMAADDVSGDCGGCAESDSALAPCPADCCAFCSTAAAVLPFESARGPELLTPRHENSARLWPGLSPSPHPTPPKRFVLS